jgi:hypothetical protein
MPGANKSNSHANVITQAALLRYRARALPSLSQRVKYQTIPACAMTFVITEDDVMYEANLTAHGKHRNHHVEMETEFALVCDGSRVSG